MVIVKIYAGLANQMFQYAFYKSLLHAGKTAYTDITSFAPQWDFENVSFAKIFPNAKLNEAEPVLIKKLANNTDRDILNKFKRKYKFLKESHFMEPKFSYNAFIYELSSDYYLEGYWQTEKYFKHIETELRHDFQFLPFTDEKNKAAAEKVKHPQAVSIHVRKGADYKKKSVVGTCDVNYYQKAIEYIKQHVENPRFFVFSDNHQWVKENLTGFDYEAIDWNPGAGPTNFYDMQLMSYCSHNIIANSSYSWWGAWLNANPNKIVIGPQKWFNTDSLNFDSSDILPENWVKL